MRKTCRLLGKKDEEIDWKDQGAEAIKLTSAQMDKCGFSHFEFRNGAFYTHPNVDKHQNEIKEEGDLVGQMRVTFKYNQCGETSIMAQQIKDPEGGYTFRKWNPLKENVPFEDHTDAEPDHSRGRSSRTKIQWSCGPQSHKSPREGMNHPE